MSKELKNLIGGNWVAPSGAESHAILNPADGETVLSTLRYSTATDVETAMATASAAFAAWNATPVVRRCRILFHCKELLEQRMGDLAACLVRENGKTLVEAEGDVRRGIEVVEFAAGMPSMAKGDYVLDIATNVDGYIYREPLGVCVGACPFNFPAMIPLWMFPVAIACGNTFVLKPSEKGPNTAVLLAEIFTEGGLPPGVLNVVHGGRETFEALITHPKTAAVSFVGSTPAAQSVYRLATQNNKRAQALGGAKNHFIVMPDADPAETLNALISSAFGCAGERCMATSVMTLVGDAENLVAPALEAAKKLKLGDGLDKSTGMGPVISAEHKKRIEDYIALGVSEGATLLLDGRNPAGVGKGYFVGPTIFDHCTPAMRIAQEEIFGPVLCIMRAKSLDEAIDWANASPLGNGASLFTASGAAAREFRAKIQCGMIGINAGVPAPMAFFSFGGWKTSLFGDLRAHGPDAIEFYTKKRAVIERWFGKGPVGSIWGK